MGQIINRDLGQYCSHIEDRLPKSSRQSIKAYPSLRIDDFGIKELDLLKEYPHKHIENKLRLFGLDRYETELIMLRYVDDMKMVDIVKQQGWLSLSSASHHLKKTLKKLREGRFKL